jgi:hypothetical protein
LKAKVVKPLQEAFLESINRRVADGQLPPDVGRLLHKKKPLLFLVRDIVSGSVECGGRAQGAQARPAASGVRIPTADNGEKNPGSGRTEPPQTLVAASEQAAEFARAFDETFRRLDGQGRSHNFVSLLELRRGLLRFDRQAFDAGLRELRRVGRYTLSAAEGRQGVSPEEQEAGIIEDGALLLYVSRKLS